MRVFLIKIELISTPCLSRRTYIESRENNGSAESAANRSQNAADSQPQRRPSNPAQMLEGGQDQKNAGDRERTLPVRRERDRLSEIVHSAPAIR